MYGEIIKKHPSHNTPEQLARCNSSQDIALILNVRLMSLIFIYNERKGTRGILISNSAKRLSEIHAARLTVLLGFRTSSFVGSQEENRRVARRLSR